MSAAGDAADAASDPRLERLSALDTAAVDWDEAAGLVAESYRLRAPKSLARAIT